MAGSFFLHETAIIDNVVSRLVTARTETEDVSNDGGTDETGDSCGFHSQLLD